VPARFRGSFARPISASAAAFGVDGQRSALLVHGTSYITSFDYEELAARSAFAKKRDGAGRSFRLIAGEKFSSGLLQRAEKRPDPDRAFWARSPEVGHRPSVTDFRRIFKGRNDHHESHRRGLSAESQLMDLGGGSKDTVDPIQISSRDGTAAGVGVTARWGSKCKRQSAFSDGAAPANIATRGCFQARDRSQAAIPGPDLWIESEIR